MPNPARVAAAVTAAAAVWAAAGTAALVVLQWQINAPYRAAYRHYRATGQRLVPPTEQGRLR